MKQVIRLTESDLHKIVKESVDNILLENEIEEGMWGGLNNVWQGINKGNLNVKQTYQAGNWASSFQKYEQQVQKIIQKMQQVAQKSGNQQVANNLATVSQQFSDTAMAFNKMANDVAKTTPQINTQVNSGFANNQQPQGQVQQQPKLNAMGQPIATTNPNNGLMGQRSESRRPRRTIR